MDSDADLVQGVRTLLPIERGYFVDCYFGELITAKEAVIRRKAAALRREKDVYLFALDKFVSRKAADPRLRSIFEIDGEFLAGPSRFINHSCQPNLRVFAVAKHSAD